MPRASGSDRRSQTSGHPGRRIRGPCGAWVQRLHRGGRPPGRRVSKQTIYNHYHSKTELIRILVERRRSLVTATLDEAPSDQPVEVTLARYAAAILEAMITRLRCS